MPKALDIWLEDAGGGERTPRPIQPLFEQLFTGADTGVVTPLRVFNFRDFDKQKIGVDMFRACCDLYGTRSWRLAHTLLLYGVLRGLINQLLQKHFSQRLRLLRNLLEASQDDIRAGERNNMPELLAEVEKLMANEPLEVSELQTFNQIQVRNETDKQAFLSRHPSLQETLHRLEDHDLLRGGLTVFDLNPTQDAGIFERRAARFPDLFAQPYSDVAGALLACGHDGRSVTRNAGYRLTYLGAPKNSEPWRDLFRARKGEENPHPSSTALMALLDSGDAPPAVMDRFVNDPTTQKDWRYYMVKYLVMRSGDSGRYIIGPGAGYAMGMLKGDYCDNRTYHCDSYLLALVEKAGMADDQIGNDKWPRCFTGDGTGPRYLELQRSGIKVRCVDAGWEFSHLPTDPAQRRAFDAVMQDQPGDQNLLCAVPQVNGIDTEDRIQLGAQLLQELVAEGL